MTARARRGTGSSGSGIALALASAATFGTSGTFASALLDAGWSPAAAVAARISLAALVLTGPALWHARGVWPRVRAAAGPILAFGLVAVAACQIAYFNAVSRMSVSIALLLEYLGVVLIVLWLWLRHGHRPRRLTLGGSALALGGLALVLDISGATHLDPVGVLWGLGAAAGLALYFVVASSADETVPPVVMAWAGLVVGAVALWAAGAVGLVDLRMSHRDVTLADHRVSWLVPVAGLALVAAAFAYVAGIGAARLLGAKLASFVGLTEVLFATLFAWWFLGQLPGAMQIAGGALIIAGVSLVRLDELRGERVSSCAAPPRTPRPEFAVPSPASPAVLTRGS
jgi:drug/metabolite transporter (DMT)-like permease